MLIKSIINRKKTRAKDKVEWVEQPLDSQQAIIYNDP